MIYPWLRHISPFKKVYNDVETFFRNLNKFYEPYIAQFQRKIKEEANDDIIMEHQLDEENESNYLLELLREIERAEQNEDSKLSDNQFT